MTPKKAQGTIRLLHTSDWHLGKRLCERSLAEAMRAFFAHLKREIIRLEVDVLLVAGDVFDSMTPSNADITLYYDFLADVAHLGLKQIVLLAGNHDSPTGIDTSKALLSHMNIHILGRPNTPQDANIILRDEAGDVYAVLVCVPFLREQDIRSNAAGEDAKARADAQKRAIVEYFAQSGDCAFATKTNLEKDNNRHIFVIGTGHLFVMGARPQSEDDGMTQISVGTLDAIPDSAFDERFDYVALGHIHKAQQVGARSHIRYSGSPIAMGFGEANAQKEFVIVDMPVSGALEFHRVPLPRFVHLLRLKGDLETLLNQIKAHKEESALCELTHTGTRVPNITQTLQEAAASTRLEILKIEDAASTPHKRVRDVTRDLGILTPMDVLNWALLSNNHSEEDAQAMRSELLDILRQMQTEEAP